MVYYLDDILIYSQTPEEHVQYVKQILAKRGELGLFCNAENCVFGAKEVRFLGFDISREGVGMEGDHVATIED